jgi:hypothetical protein
MYKVYIYGEDIEEWENCSTIEIIKKIFRWYKKNHEDVRVTVYENDIEVDWNWYKENGFPYPC